jgi:hypothetical protein
MTASIDVDGIGVDEHSLPTATDPNGLNGQTAFGLIINVPPVSTVWSADADSMIRRRPARYGCRQRSDYAEVSSCPRA